jgi:hypothetical protein
LDELEKAEGKDPVNSTLKEKLHHLVNDAQAQLQILFDLKKVVVNGARIELVWALPHMLQEERMFAWLATVRPSEACTSVLDKMGKSLSNGKKMQLEDLKVLHF